MYERHKFSFLLQNISAFYVYQLIKILHLSHASSPLCVSNCLSCTGNALGVVFVLGS